MAAQLLTFADHMHAKSPLSTQPTSEISSKKPDDSSPTRSDGAVAPTEAESSFTRGLFAGVVDDQLIFPYPPGLEKRNPEEAVVVRRLMAEIDRMERTGIIAPPRVDEEEIVSEEVIAEFARAGILGMTIPKLYGGLELSHTGYARVFERVSAVDPSLAVMVGVHCGLGSKAIVLYGTEEQKERYLPMLARGETLAAYALTE